MSNLTEKEEKVVNEVEDKYSDLNYLAEDDEPEFHQYVEEHYEELKDFSTITEDELKKMKELRSFDDMNEIPVEELIELRAVFKYQREK